MSVGWRFCFEYLTDLHKQLEQNINFEIEIKILPLFCTRNSKADLLSSAKCPEGLRGNENHV